MKICKRDRITDFPYINLVRVDYQDRNDRDKSWIYATRGKQQGPDAVVIVPFHVLEKKLVVIRQFRLPLESLQYEFPAGLVDPGETVSGAGARELLEETGLVLKKVLGQSPQVYSSSGLTDESVSLLFVECDGTASTRLNEGSEEIEVMMVSQQEAAVLLREPCAKFDVKTWIVLERFAATGRVI